ncbi:MAG: rhomboid family intramembrane serine protease [Thermoplasmata archaeon]
MIYLNELLFLIILIFLFLVYIKNRLFVLYTSLFLIIIFVMELFLSYLGYNPIYIFGYSSLNPISFNILDSIFIHESFLHIISNVIIFLLIGIPLEERIGTRKILIYFITAGVFANVIFILYNLNNYVILVGASGAIFGIMGVFLRLYPDDEIPMFLGFIFLPRIKVKYAVLAFVLFELILELLNVNNGVAHLAHLAGFAFGFIIPSMNLKYNKYSELESFAENERDLEEIKDIKNTKDPLVRKYLIENFLKKKCKHIEIKEYEILCDNKKIKL